MWKTRQIYDAVGRIPITLRLFDYALGELSNLVSSLENTDNQPGESDEIVESFVEKYRFTLIITHYLKANGETRLNGFLNAWIIIYNERFFPRVLMLISKDKVANMSLEFVTEDDLKLLRNNFKKFFEAFQVAT